MNPICRTKKLFVLPILVVTITILSAGCKTAPVASPALRAAISTDIPPYVIKDASSGFEVDLVRQLLAGHEVQFVSMPYADLQTTVPRGRADIAIGVQHFSDDGVFYSDDILSFQNFAISKVSAKLKIDKVSDLSGHPVLTWEDAYLELGPDFQKLFGPDSLQRSNYIEFADQEEQVRKFWESEDAVAVIDRSIFDYLSEAAGHSTADVVYHPLFPEVTNFKVGFKDEALRDAFNLARVQFCRSGGYEGLLERYRMKLPRTVCEP